MLEKNKYYKNAIALSPNIIPKKIYANFLPIKAVTGSSFTLIVHLKFCGKLNTFYNKTFFIGIIFKGIKIEVEPSL